MKNLSLLCFDYGTKRIGVAAGQTITATATALKTLHNRDGRPDWAAITRLINDWRPDRLIVGQPLTLAGERQALTGAAERFARQLEGRFKLGVELMDERLSSFAARRESRSTRDLDPVAARLILETWLGENAAQAGLAQSTRASLDHAQSA